MRIQRSHLLMLSLLQVPIKMKEEARQELGLAKLPPKISLRSSIEYFINSLLPVELCPIKRSFSNLLHYFERCNKYLQGDPTISVWKN